MGLVMDEDWDALAACRGWPTDWWFPEYDPLYVGDIHPEQTAAAMALCASCPVWKECLEEAYTNDHAWKHGIRGGLAGNARLVSTGFAVRWGLDVMTVVQERAAKEMGR